SHSPRGSGRQRLVQLPGATWRSLSLRIDRHKCHGRQNRLAWAGGQSSPDWRPCDKDADVKTGFLSEIFVSFQGEGAHVGRQHLFIRLAGCNLRCSYCDTPDSLERTPNFTLHGRNDPPHIGRNPLSSSELADLVAPLIARHAPVEAIALTGGEPLVQSEFLAEFLKVGAFGLPVLLETNGMLPSRLRDVLPFVDIISMDI